MTEDQPQVPFAELWMGDHPPIPSDLKHANGDTVNLKELINQDPERFLGKAYAQFEKKKLPFLFKVLSVNKALSLQVHPNKTLAEELHAQFPDVYKDDNHKPEISIAISEFEALCNFRPYEELLETFREVPVLREFIGEDVIENFQTCQEEEKSERLRDIIKSIFKRDKDAVKEATTKLVYQITQKDEKSKRDELVLRLHKQFPFDIGLLISYLLNYLVIQPGEAFVMDPCEPHAYLYGNCLEVMAASDNVIRGCMTPKLIDKETLCRALSCQMKNTTVISGEQLSTHKKDGFEVTKYPTAYEEFVCFKVEIKQKETETSPFVYPYPSIALVLKGKGTVSVKAINEHEYQSHQVNEGESIFVLPDSHIKFSSNDDEFVAYLSTSQSL